ncbi:MAG TPA: ATPase [Cyanobacteria bacterium UBA8803]|nr:ATPase [Cyanobacteria bacterium UBA9273]HBL58389.1 ATPase [Cyanobacteria bacterium UBA8803]
MPESRLNVKEKWFEANQNYLMGEIARLRQALQSKSGLTGEGMAVSFDPHSFLKDNQSPNPEEFPFSTPPLLAQLCYIFGLSPFERDILLLCAGMEFDGSWGALCAAVVGNSQLNYPTFSLALTILPQGHWGALAPNGPLRRWRLIEIGEGNALTSSLLRIDERILHYLRGIQYLDERLAVLEEPMPMPGLLVPSHQQLVQQIAATWGQALEGQLPTVQLCGEDAVSKRAIARAVCDRLGIQLHAISGEAIPTDTSQLNLMKVLYEREWALNHTGLLLNCDPLETPEAARESAIARFIENFTSPLIVTSRDRIRQRQQALITFDVYHPTTNEQRLIWKNALAEITTELDGQVDLLVSHFNLSAAAIQATCLTVKSLEQETSAEDQSENPEPSPLHTQLWNICCTQARPRLDELAQRIDTVAAWDDLILPEKERNVLREIAAHVRQRSKVYESWGFARKSKRGLGISALFAGASGTGKTMAAEVLGNELRLDVYRIDLSSVVSKYIGETEKNLRRIFDAAEGGGAILLFDEADALFGKRSEVKDSHDRYANIEVGYLLQRMEAYRGLAILTTNLKTSIDQAFLRRIRFIVQFPFPDANQRTEIWQHIFPQQTPTQGLDYKKLAKLNVAGGNIRNIALNAAFLAADADESVQMKHLLQAAKSEYVKLERPLTDVEIKGWV